VVSPELKEAINAVSPPKLEQNRNVFLVRRGRGLGIVHEIKDNMEAASGFEPLHRGFADLSLNHLGTPPMWIGNMNFPRVATTAEIIDNPEPNK
jgi:hypothetical protein